MRKKQNWKQGSDGAGKGLTERFQIKAQNEPKILLERVVESTGLYSRVKPNIPFADLLLSNQTRHGVRFLNPPFLSCNDVFEVMVDELVNLVSSWNQQYYRDFFDEWPELDMTSGVDVFDVRTRVEALVSLFRDYDAKWMYLVALQKSAILLAMTQGEAGYFPVRAAGVLRRNVMQTMWRFINGLPIRKQAYAYINEHWSILVKKGIADTVNVCFPMPLPLDRTHIDFVNQRANLTAGPAGTGVRLPLIAGTDFVFPLTMHQIGNVPFGLGDVDSLTFQKLVGLVSNGATEAIDATKASHPGMIVNSIFNRLGVLEQQLYAQFRSTFLREESAHMKLFCGKIFPAFNIFAGDRLSIEQVYADAKNPRIEDYDDWFANHAIYRRWPEPELSPYALGRFPFGNYGPFATETGAETDTFTYRNLGFGVPHRDKVNEVLRLFSSINDDGSLPSQEQLKTPKALATTAILTEYVGMYISDPDELNRFLDFLSFGSKTDKSISGHKYKDYTPDWSKIAIIGTDNELGQATILGKLTSSPLGDVERGLGSMLFDTGFEAVPFTGAGTVDARQGHVGFVASVVNLMLMLSNTSSYFTDKAGKTVSEMLAMGGDLGNWFMRPDEFRSGLFLPRGIIRPLINRADPLQCGSFMLLASEDVDQSTVDKQVDPWGWFAANGLNSGVIQEILAVKNCWANDGYRKILKDTLMYIGDDFGSTPLAHFQRTDTCTYWLKENIVATARYPGDGVFWPIKPYVSRDPFRPRQSKYLISTLGLFFEQSLKTFMSGAFGVPPKASWITSLMPFLDGMVNGQSFPVYKPLVAWRDWLPHLVYDQAYPIMESLSDYIVSAEDRFHTIFNGASSASLLARELKTTSIKSAQIDSAVSKVLNLPYDQARVAKGYKDDGSRGPSHGARHAKKEKAVRHEPKSFSASEAPISQPDELSKDVMSEPSKAEKATMVAEMKVVKSKGTKAIGDNELTR